MGGAFTGAIHSPFGARTSSDFLELGLTRIERIFDILDAA
jgi:hypothetical protein